MQNNGKIISDIAKYMVGEELSSQRLVRMIVDDLFEGDIDYEIEPKDWTKEKVTIKLKSNVEGEYNLQYSFDRKKWEEYKEKIEVEKNITIYICLINSAGKQGSATSLKIANIDKLSNIIEIKLTVCLTSLICVIFKIFQLH